MDLQQNQTLNRDLNVTSKTIQLFKIILLGVAEGVCFSYMECMKPFFVINDDEDYNLRNIALKIKGSRDWILLFPKSLVKEIIHTMGLNAIGFARMLQSSVVVDVRTTVTLTRTVTIVLFTVTSAVTST